MHWISRTAYDALYTMHCISTTVYCALHFIYCILCTTLAGKSAKGKLAVHNIVEFNRLVEQKCTLNIAKVFSTSLYNVYHAVHLFLPRGGLNKKAMHCLSYSGTYCDKNRLQQRYWNVALYIVIYDHIWWYIWWYMICISYSAMHCDANGARALKCREH